MSVENNYIFFSDYHPAGDGKTDDSAALQQAIKTAAESGKKLIIGPAGESYRLGQDVRFPQNLVVEFLPKAILKPDYKDPEHKTTIEIHALIVAGNYCIFASSGLWLSPLRTSASWYPKVVKGHVKAVGEIFPPPTGSIRIFPEGTPVVHTSWFGLDSSGYHEEQTMALQKALDSLQDGSTLLIDAGAKPCNIEAGANSYNVYGAISLQGKKRVSVMAERGASIKQNRASTKGDRNNCELFICTDCHDLIFDGLSLEGLGTDADCGSQDPVKATGIELRDCSQVVLRKLTLKRFGYTAIDIFQGTRDVTIKDCAIEGTGKPQIQSGCLDQVNQYGVCSDTPTHGGELRISGCNICHTATGIFLSGGQAGSSWDSVCLEGNYIHDIDGQSGVYIDYVKNLTFANNRIRNCPWGAGLKCQITPGAREWVDNYTITGNVVENTWQGILLFDEDQATHQGYYFRNVTVAGNTVTDTSGPGIDCRKCLNAIITGNSVRNCGGYGINVKGNQIAVTCNTIQRTGFAGIRALVGHYREEWSSANHYRQGEIVLAGGGLYEAQRDGGEAQDPKTDGDRGLRSVGPEPAGNWGPLQGGPHLYQATRRSYQYWLPLGRVDFVDISNNTIHYPCCPHHKYCTALPRDEFDKIDKIESFVKNYPDGPIEREEKKEARERGYGYTDEITGTEGYIGISLAAGPPYSGAEGVENPPPARAFVRNNLMLRGDPYATHVLNCSIYAEKNVELHALRNWFAEDCGTIYANPLDPPAAHEIIDAH
jgi:hypothetical protein